MKIPLSWLKEFVDVPVEAARLGEDLTLVGLALEGIERHGADAVLDLDVTTNRVDCMNVHGVAREASVIYALPLRSLDLTFAEAGTPARQALEVEIEAPDLCPRFCARVLDVRLGPSPAWLRDRLELVGVRPINNVVDVTNYVMMEMGQPSHAFDLARIPGGKLVARWAREGERLTTLDGAERVLTSRHGVVASPEGALALAGVMGGAASEVSEATRTVALEAAYWDPLSIRRGAKALGMHTEASHRFERGADPEGTAAATARIAHLLGRIGAGTARPGLIDRLAAPPALRQIALRPSRTDAVLGTTVPRDRARAILTGLGFRPGAESGEATSFTVPSWRGDVSREIDLVEEVGRHHGLGNIPPTVPPARGAEGLRPRQVRERRLRDLLVGAGLTEVVTHAFVSDALAAGSPPRVAVENPLSEEQGVLRSSLVVPGLLSTLRTNLRQGRRDVAVFETGRVFSPREGAPGEEPRLGLLLAGELGAGHWSARGRVVDFFDVKALVELVAERLGPGAFTLATDGLPALLHPGKAARVADGGTLSGWLGALHPDVLRAWDLRGEVYVAELPLDPFLEAPSAPPRYRPLAKAPAVLRDLSVVCDRSLTVAALEARVRSAAGEHLRSLRVVDLYEGPPVPAGRVGVTLALAFQDPERTLTGEEVQGALDRVVGDLRAAGAEIRGE
ncbi:MAG TPA: phenylalanine--tRNA ligase subunit beta [Vicinamibacteria bacterium]|nr:phenylalanine--tRNA ligase subunit beta [Vicinamibacteria bacterium]